MNWNLFPWDNNSIRGICMAKNSKTEYNIKISFSCYEDSKLMIAITKSTSGRWSADNGIKQSYLCRWTCI